MLQRLVGDTLVVVIIIIVFMLIGLNIVHTLLHKFSICEQDPASEFFKTYFLDLMQHVLAVVTDTSHTARKHN